MIASSNKQSPERRVTDAMFHPNSIAVIGASSDSKKEHASGWVGRLLRAGFQGRIYPINPSAEEICGLKAYPSISSVPAEVDYAILALASRIVPKVLEECINKGVKTVHCYAAGFAESGTEQGIKLQAQLVELLQESKTRMIGPNCLGIYCPKSGLAMDGRFSKESGPIGFLSQTGTGLMQLVSESNARGLRFSKAVSFGNALDLDASDFLDYFAADQETKIILVYVEGINRNGRRFFQTLRECNKVKPVVFLKGGLSESGAGVALSHTGSLAGSKQTWHTLFRQTKVVAVQSFEEAVEQMVALVHMPPAKGRRVGIVGRGGGIGVTTTDMCEREGLAVPEFTPQTKEKLGELTPPGGGSIVRNPVEIGLGKFGVSEHYVEALSVVDADPNIDLTITFLDPEQYLEHIKADWIEGAKKSLIEAAKKVKKPLIVVFKPGSSTTVFEWTKQLISASQEAGLPAYKSLETAIKAASKHIQYTSFKSSISSKD